jgi:hypothetical protein
VRRGDGDDDDCIDDDFEKWTSDLFVELDKHPALLGAQASVADASEPAPAAYDVEIIAGGAACLLAGWQQRMAVGGGGRQGVVVQSAFHHPSAVRILDSPFFHMPHVYRRMLGAPP